MAYCNKCGKEMDKVDLFCHACGATVAKAGGAVEAGPPGEDSSPLPPPGSAPMAAPAPMPPVAAPVYAGGPQAESLQGLAEKRVEERMALWWHLGSYVIVNTFLVIIWAISGAGYPWFIWVMIGWGIGVVFHLMHYLLNVHAEGSRDRMVQKEMEKLQRKQGAAGEPGAAPEKEPE